MIFIHAPRPTSTTSTHVHVVDISFILSWLFLRRKRVPISSDSDHTGFLNYSRSQLIFPRVSTFSVERTLISFPSLLPCYRFSSLTMGSDTPKTKKSEKIPYQEKLKFANLISKPMAPKGTTKRLLKLVKKGMPIVHSSIFMNTFVYFG